MISIIVLLLALVGCLAETEYEAAMREKRYKDYMLPMDVSVSPPNILINNPY